MLLVLRNRPLSTQCVYVLLVCPLRGSVLISVMVDILTSMEYAGVVIIIVYNVKMHQINARNAKEDGVYMHKNKNVLLLHFVLMGSKFWGKQAASQFVVLTLTIWKEYAPMADVLLDILQMALEDVSKVQTKA